MKIHQLKIENKYFIEVCSRKKNFEIRFDHKGYEVGDFLLLKNLLDNRNLIVRVKYILSSKEFEGISPGYVVMAIKLPHEINVFEMVMYRFMSFKDKLKGGNDEN